eukprot:6180187-Pleurochrysis_carterae.AAC.1
MSKRSIIAKRQERLTARAHEPEIASASEFSRFAVFVCSRPLHEVTAQRSRWRTAMAAEDDANSLENLRKMMNYALIKERKSQCCD